MSSERGGGGGSSTTSTNTNVSVTTNVTGPPINIAVGSDFLKPVADTFQPVAAGIKQSLDSTAAYVKESNDRLTMRQDELEKLLKLAVVLTLAGVGYQFIQTQRRAA